MTLEEISNACTAIVPGSISDLSLGRFCERSYDPVVAKSDIEQVDFLTEPTPSNDQITEALAVFPNPFKDQLNVNLKESQVEQSLRFDLHNILGKLVWAQQGYVPAAGQYVLDTNFSELASGTYLLTISGKTFTESVTLQKR